MLRPPASENLLARKLGSFLSLCHQDRTALDTLWNSRPNLVSAQHDIAREGEPPGCARLVLSGWACRYKILPDGRRQLLGFLLPGDLCDLDVFVFNRLDHSLLALTPVRYVALGLADLDTLKAKHPAAFQALCWDSLVNAAMQREWTVNLGKRSAIERLSHLLCELFVRLQIVGMTRDNAYHLPVTQIELADALGLSPVHVNRTLRELRERRLITLQDRQLELPDFDTLRHLAMFDPAYLHINKGAADPD